MPRGYRHVKEYGAEILRMRGEGATKREIAEKFGMSVEQIKGFLKRHRRNEEKKSSRNYAETKGSTA